VVDAASVAADVAQVPAPAPVVRPGRSLGAGAEGRPRSHLS